MTTYIGKVLVISISFCIFFFLWCFPRDIDPPKPDVLRPGIARIRRSIHGHTTTVIHDMSTPPPSAAALDTHSQCGVIRASAKQAPTD